MNILEEIVAAKKKEVARRKKDWPVNQLEKERFFQRKTLSLAKSVRDEKKTSIIAEYKRRSPSKGIINNRNSVEAVTRAYAAYGASGISVLTDLKFFGGSLDDLVSARDNTVPLLRKEFIIDEYQVLEARAFGADAILLIAACLSPHQVKTFSALAVSLKMEVLLELHDEQELNHLCEHVALVGINNRNLKDFTVNLDHSLRMVENIGNDHVKIAESGMNSVEDVHYLKKGGFDGFLIGEYFMKQENPMMAFKNFSYDL
ncbi:MAG: indole-3-glycerol phosphate synthase TrpC [Flavisolibacter sp.]|jgi:indole-3-glycerol phosphate synthase|nr:indole-3-glycerol phosphate synthase TrpC [Flavisolibacter sp.]